jgi:hypothetical protein
MVMEIWFSSPIMYEFKCRNVIVIVILQYYNLYFLFKFIMYFKNKVDFGSAILI